jgi:CheY-like chemotaxis protein
MGYAGPRRQVLVVDNEEVDRTLLAGRLQGLGFVVHTAASGAAALALLAERPVHAILMDLAMPGMDGWETLRTLRRQGLSEAPAAVVSANAFDKGLDNDVGITSADFITKPVRFDELLDWLGERLPLQWLDRPGAAPVPASANTSIAAPPAALTRLKSYPSRARLMALADVVALGYPKGVQRALDEIDASHPDGAAWSAPLRVMAQQFSFERMTLVIQDALDKSHTA